MKLDLPKNKVLKYLGHRGQDLTPINDILDETIEKVKQASNIKSLIDYQTIVSRNENSVALENGLVLSGNSITKLLAECGETAVIMATLGRDFDLMTMKYQTLSPLKAIIADAAGSAYIEEVMDHINNEIMSKKKNITRRFSPGFGDLDIKVNKELIRIYNAERRLGITINQNYLMSPMKSVTAFIGIRG